MKSYYIVKRKRNSLPDEYLIQDPNRFNRMFWAVSNYNVYHFVSQKAADEAIKGIHIDCISSDYNISKYIIYRANIHLEEVSSISMTSSNNEQHIRQKALMKLTSEERGILGV